MGLGYNLIRPVRMLDGGMSAKAAKRPDGAGDADGFMDKDVCLATSAASFPSRIRGVKQSIEK